jgi:hypothetical protein
MTYYPQNHVKPRYKESAYPSYFPEKYRYKPPQPTKPKQLAKAINHIRRNKHHYHFIALSIILGFLAALALTLAINPIANAISRP